MTVRRSHTLGVVPMWLLTEVPDELHVRVYMFKVRAKVERYAKAGRIDMVVGTTFLSVLRLSVVVLIAFIAVAA